VSITFHRTLGGAAGVALSATLLNYRQDVRPLLFSQQHALYPLGTDVAADTVRTILMQEGLRDDTLNDTDNEDEPCLPPAYQTDPALG